MSNPQGPAGIPGKAPAQRVDPGKSGSAPAKPEGKSEFAGLLERLRRLGGESRTAGLAKKKDKALDPAALAQRLEEAERTFRKAMEIRRGLEEAWRSAGKRPYAGGNTGKGGEE